MPLKLKKRGQIWHYSGTVAGRRLRGTTGATDKAVAQRIASEVETRAWSCHLDGPEAHVTMAQAAIAYRNAEKAIRFLDAIEDYWQDTLLRKIEPEAIRQSAIELYPNVSGATRNRQVIIPTMAVINHAAGLGWCSRIKVERFKVIERTRKYVTPDWVAIFEAQARKDGLPHLAALCLFMFGTGARLGEATALTWDDLDLHKRQALIRQSKNSMERTSHLPPPVLAALANIPSNRNPMDKVFCYAGSQSVKQVWNNVVARAGLEHLTPHCCRHGFATAMLRARIDVKTVAKLGGWKDASIVLKHYAHALEDPTVTDAVFGTEMTQAVISEDATTNKKRKKGR